MEGVTVSQGLVFGLITVFPTDMLRYTLLSEQHILILLYIQFHVCTPYTTSSDLEKTKWWEFASQNKI